MVATWDKVRPRTHLLLIWLYAFAAFMSLVIIQGILAFMLTPGRWIETRSFWDGFLNPTYLPGLVLRTGICLLLAGAYMTLRGAAREGHRRPARGWCACWPACRWSARCWRTAATAGGRRRCRIGAGAVPRATADARLAGHDPLAWPCGRSPPSWCWCCWRLAAAAGAAVAARRRRRCCAAFVFFGGYERVREGARKPFVIRDYMFSNGILVSEIADLNERGVLAKAGWAAVGQPDTPEGRGRAVFRAQCAACHTLDGYLVDPPARGAGRRRHDQRHPDDHEGHGRGVRDAHARGERVDTTKLDYPFMPPLVGTDDEVEALTAYLVSLKSSHRRR